MAYAKLEPSGCCVHKGKIQLRISMYLEPSDPYYEKHHVFVIDETSSQCLAGYNGEVDSRGKAVDLDAYRMWLASLPRVWKDNPFNNHFVFVDASVSDTEIRQLVSGYLDEFFAVWIQGKDIGQYWQARPNKPRFVAGDLLHSQSCKDKLEEIKSRISQFEIKKW